MSFAEWQDGQWLEIADGSGEPLVIEDDLLATVVGFLDVDTRRSDAVRDAGLELFEALVKSGAGARWSERFLTLSGCRRTLFDITTPKLLSVPWEILHDGHAYVFRIDQDDDANHDHNCLRYRNEWSSCRLSAGLPLRVLVLVGEPDWQKYGIKEEVDELERLAGAHRGVIDLVVLQAASAQSVKEHITHIRPHVFHFIGHREWDESGHNAILRVKPKEGMGGSWRLDADRIAELMNPVPPLIIVNTCDIVSAARPVSSADVLPLYEAFIKRGPRALLTMQANVKRHEAHRITKEFYSRLLESKSVDVAVNHARSSLMGTTESGRWALPVLTLVGASSLEAVLPAMLDQKINYARACAEAVDAEKVEKTPAIDRGLERWDLYRKLVEPDDAATVGRLFLVVGEKDVGKSTLVNSCTAQLAVAGKRVVRARFVDGGGPSAGGPRDWLSSLRFIDAQLERTINQDLDDEARAALSEAIAAFRAAADSHGQAGRGTAASHSSNPRYIARGDDVGGYPGALKAAFGELVAAFCAVEPLFLLVDHWERGISRDDVKQLIECLLAAADQSPKVRIVVTLTAAQANDADFGRLLSRAKQLVLKPFHLEVFDQHFDALAKRCALSEAELAEDGDLRVHYRGLAIRRGQTWSPKWLAIRWQEMQTAVTTG